MNSKNKGNTFERKIAKTLSERFEAKTGLKTAFRRNIDSGSFFGGKNVARTQSHDLDKATMGDLICPNTFVFTVECKHYKTAPTFLSILKQDNKMLDKWIAQVEQDGVSSNKKPMVVMKFNLVPEMAMVKRTEWKGEVNIGYKDYVILPLEEFLTETDTFFFE